MTREQLEQLTSWARRLSTDSDVPEARAAARAVLLLADGGSVSDDQVDEMAVWARRVRTTSDAPDARAAARAILMLADSRSEATNGSEGAPPPAPSAAQALAERLRRGPADRPVDGNGAASEAPRTLGDTLRERAAARRSRPAAPQALPASPRPVPEPEPELDEARAEIRAKRDARAAEAHRRRRRARARLAFLLGGVVVLLGGGYEAAARVTAPDLSARGPADPLIGARELATLAFSVAADEGDLEKIRWKLDGADVTAQASPRDGRLVFRPRGLGDGRHTVSVSASGPIPGADSGETWHVLVDTRAPSMRLSGTSVPKGRPLRLVGRTEAGARVEVDGRPVQVNGAGRFTVARPTVPRRPLQLVATDAHGNVARQAARIQLVPRRPPVAVRGVHVTAHAWADETLRRGILDLVEQGRINTVELDIKDEAGLVGFDADVPLGKRIGAVQEVYDLQEAVRELHERGVWVVGRLVAFRDPIHARAAWRAGRRNEVVQTPGGGQYAGYGGFTNFANPAVREYNIAVAKAAADAGVDDILYDYIRRPDGPVSSMVFPGLRGKPEASLVRFLEETVRALRGTDVYVGASVFGVAATRPEEVAQDIPGMAREIDYIAPMLYPSHWGPGEYDVANPNAEPYAIIRRSLADFKRQTRGTGARVVPWLQDFSLGVDYGPAEVRAQIDAARDVGIREWLLWDPLVTYTADALARNARGAKLPAPRTQPASPKPPAASPAAPGSAAAVRANELGSVPVVMYHQIRADGGGDYDLTPAEFRAELARLHREGYRPIRAVDLVRGRIDVPAGKTPVVLTFDDSTKEQLAYDANGEVKRDTAIGIMLDFARRHPDFKPAGTFFVNREPFAGVAEGEEMLRFLVEQGFELGNHTHDHIPLNEKDATGVQQALVLGKRVITSAVPRAQVATLALPLGAMPDDAALALRGSWGGESYRHEGVFLVGAEPAPSPFSRDWNPGGVPRIRTGPWSGGEPNYAAGFWLDWLKQNPERRYVSDGDPRTIAFPRAQRAQLRPRFEDRARPY